MANDESKVVPANLKVPPLKIVLSAHQSGSNLVGSVSVDEETPVIFKTCPEKPKELSTEEHSLSSSSGRRNGASGSSGGAGHSTDQRDKHHKRAFKSNSESLDDSSSASRPTRFLSTSSSTSSSDRSSSTTPSSESESLASNSTIISENQQEKIKADTTATTTTTTSKDEAGGGLSSASVHKQDRSSTRHGSASKTSNNEKSSSSSTPNKRTHEQEHSHEQHTPSYSAGTRDHTSNANQRITRSSQRAAQQTKASETTADSNGDESAPNETHEKIPDSSRKVKRRKGEVQDSEHDTQSAAQATPAMANICPADYLLPLQNSFELYRDIRKQPYKELMKLSLIQPKMPLGFKDYLINGGPYLLEGNKLGTGLGAHRMDNLNNVNSHKTVTATSNRAPLRARPSNYKNSSLNSLLQRHNLYAIPKPLEVPKSLQVGTPLHDLFQEQEKARQQMRMQHLKERERAILAAEQEILRAYNNAAIADVRQKRHLSACTFFYYHERYHYLSDSTQVNGTRQLDGDNSSLINDNQNGEGSKEIAPTKTKDSDNVVVDTNGCASDTQDNKEEKNGSVGEDTSDSKDMVSVKTHSDKNDAMDMTEEGPNGRRETSPNTNGSKVNISEVASDDKLSQRRTSKDIDSVKIDGDTSESKNDEQSKSLKPDLDESSLRSPFKDNSANKNISDEDLKLLNKEIFITQLHQIDDKWDYIKRDMMVRHKNEADSLNAVQSLDWEWKAKEIGVCDVRVTLKVEPEFVPKVEVEAHNY